MLQVLDVVHIGRLPCHSGDSFRVIGKVRDQNEPVVLDFDDYLYQVFVAVGPNFTAAHIPLLANKLVGYARGQTVVQRAELVWGNDIGEGYQPQPKPFLRLEVFSVHWFERFEWQQFVQKAVRELSKPAAEVEGCYEVSSKPIDLFLKQTGIHGLAWLDSNKRVIKKEEEEEEEVEFVQLGITVQSLVINGQKTIACISTNQREGQCCCHFIWRPSLPPKEGDLVIERKTEAEMLQAFHCYVLNEVNPDLIIVGDASVLALIKDRTEKNRLPKMEWSRVKELPMRFEEGEYSHPKGFQVEKLRIRCPGRVIVDLYSLMLNLHSDNEGGMIKGRGLEELAECAGVSPLQYQIENEEDMCMLFYGSPEDCKSLLRHGRSQALKIFEITEEQATVETLFALCKTMRTIPTDQLEGTISQRVERMIKARSFPLMLLAKDKGDKWIDRSYEGGLIQLPEPLLTSHPVFPLDVKSMYPSLICEGNMCLTTQLPDGSYVSPEVKKGLLPTILQELMDERQQVKEVILQQGQTPGLEGKQKALKIAANATYGTLALKHCTMSSIPLAEDTCERGRRLISRMRDWVSSTPLLSHLKPRVVYVHTDCLFVECRGLDQSLSWEEKHQAYTLIHHLMEKEVMPLGVKLTLEDYVIDRMLLVAKNNYAYRCCYQGGAVKDHFKGLSCVRFTSFPFASRAIKGLLGIILRPWEQNHQEWIDYVVEQYKAVGQVVRSSLIEPEFVMMVRVQKSIGPGRGETEALRLQRTNSLPFKLASQMKGHRVRSGDVLQFVFATDETPVPVGFTTSEQALDPLIYERMFRSDLTRILSMVLEPERMQEVFGSSQQQQRGGGSSSNPALDGKVRNGIRITSLLKDSGVSDELMKSLTRMQTNTKIDVKQQREDYFKRYENLYNS